MANTSRPRGLIPISQPYGNIRVTYYEAITGQNIFRYQPVALDANGRVIVATASNMTVLVGSVVGFLDGAWGPIDDSFPYMPTNPVAHTTGGVMHIAVADDPQQEFMIEEDTGGGALDAQAINAGAVFTYIATTGNTTTGISNAVLDRSAIGTGTDLTLRLIRKWDKEDNAYGDYCKWVVQIVRHQKGAQQEGTTVLI